MENKKSPSGDIISSKKNNNNIKARLIFSFDLTKDISNPKFILQDLKLEIKKSYSIQDNEYDLFIGANKINLLPNDTLINALIKKYNENKIVIKSYRNTFDIEKQLNDYEDILTKKIIIKNDEIKALNLEYEKLMQDLKNFK